MAGQTFGTPGGSDERPATFFADAAEFRGWLEENHATASELWMGLRKKHVPDHGLTWEDAVPEALCFGWIDSVAQRVDADITRQRWTPRRPTSIWSDVNIALVERLTAQGRMRPAGLAAYALRRPERSGVYAYEKPTIDTLPEPYASQLAADAAASVFWAQAPAGYRKTAVHWVTSAQQQVTRDRRAAQLVADSASGQLIKPQRYGDEPAWLIRARAAIDAVV